MSFAFRAETFDAARYIEQNLSKAQLERKFGAWCQLQTDLVDVRNAELAGQIIPKALTVDGESVSRFRSVPLTSVARVDWQNDYDIVSWIWQKLHDLSPVKTGRYRASHVLMCDGEIVDGPSPAIAAEDQWTFVSPVVYARKIEGTAAAGGGRRPPQSPQAPEGVYAVVAALAAERFRNVSIKFTYVQLFSAATSDGNRSVSVWAAKKFGSVIHADGSTKSRHARNLLRDATRNPAIVLRFKTVAA